jgi:hypothetical protein
MSDLEQKAERYLQTIWPKGKWKTNPLYLNTLTALLREVIEDAKGTLFQFYPHMCRDGHDEVGWRGDEELCPACRALNAKDAEWVRAVKERATFPEDADDILRRMGVGVSDAE